jgi:uncharacterized protein (TIGR03118 family)
VVKTTDGSVYTGLTNALIDGKRYLYAANVTKGRVDVYDNGFHLVNLNNNDPHRNDFDSDHSSPGGQPFGDPQLPRDYVPFNVATIGNDIFVTYALDPSGQPLPTAGPGFGYLDIFNSTGQLLQRLEHGSWLNVPWGVTLAPLDFGRFSHDLLVGQFANAGNTESAGVIAAYDLVTGKFEGLIQSANGQPLIIQGIWSLGPGNVSPSSRDPDDAPLAQVYFTAGLQRGDRWTVWLSDGSPDRTHPREQSVSHDRATPSGVHWTVKFAAFHLPVASQKHLSLS